MQKRAIVPQGDTPGKPGSKRVSVEGHSSRELFAESPLTVSEWRKAGKKYSWSRDELYHLVELIALNYE